MRNRLAVFLLTFMISAMTYGCGGTASDGNGAADPLKDEGAVISEDITVTDDAAADDIRAVDTCPYALMHDGVMYYHTGEYIFERIKVSDDDILGSVTSVIPESGMPKEDGQANVPIEGSVFIKHELAGDGLLVLIGDKWYIFETRN